MMYGLPSAFRSAAAASQGMHSRTDPSSMQQHPAFFTPPVNDSFENIRNP
jgi:hypothetical protein